MLTSAEYARLAPVFRHAVELVAVGIAVYDGPTGRPLYVNAALRRLMRGARDRAVLTRALRASAHALAGRDEEAFAAAAERRVDAGGSCYRVTAVEIPRDDGPGMVLVVVDRAGERPGEALARSRLTPRECAVAMLIARGRSNGEISDTLGISAHTARHHTESVMRKLGVRSRTQVAARVLGAEALGALAELRS